MCVCVCVYVYIYIYTYTHTYIIAAFIFLIIGFYFSDFTALASIFSTFHKSSIPGLDCFLLILKGKANISPLLMVIFEVFEATVSD